MQSLGPTPEALISQDILALMSESSPPPAKLTPDQIVWAYSRGLFPMAASRHAPIQWYEADPRAVLPLDSFHVSRSLRRRLNRNEFEITLDRAFGQVIEGCSRPRSYTDDTWINDEIIHAYTALHHHGLAHSVEAWRKGQLVGGIYGVALGGVFFGESMFSRATDASKVCLARAVEHLRARGFSLFDVQFTNPHLEQFGVVEIPREEYLTRLMQAIQLNVRW